MNRIADGQQRTIVLDTTYWKEVLEQDYIHTLIELYKKCKHLFAVSGPMTDDERLFYEKLGDFNEVLDNIKRNDNSCFDYLSGFKMAINMVTNGVIYEDVDYMITNYDLSMDMDLNLVCTRRYLHG